MALMDWHVSMVQKGDRPMSLYPQAYVCMATMGLPLTTVTILMRTPWPSLKPNWIS
jgi:hypothetical protein